MHEIHAVPEHLSDPDLIAEVTRLAALERKAIATLELQYARSRVFNTTMGHDVRALPAPATGILK